MRRRINIMYFAALAIAAIVYVLFTSLQKESVFFYGFAENKETEINHIDDVLIHKIHVVNGQEVSQGDLLLEVNIAGIAERIQELELQKNVLNVDASSKKINLENEIEEFKTAKQNEITKIDSEISEIRIKVKLEQELYDDLKSVVKPNYSNQQAAALEIEALEKEKSDMISKYDQKVSFKKEEIKLIYSPSTIKKRILDTEIGQLNKETMQQSIDAPSDGLIGTIFCKEGENISKFRTLMNFYKHNPTQVKGFVHESMILHVKVGDKLDVSSSLHTAHLIEGEVIGLGSRIVEIPERLRKIPSVKTYGREILIEIPAENNFLQKEKVMLNASKLVEGKTLGNLFSYSNTKYEKTEKSLKKAISIND